MTDNARKSPAGNMATGTLKLIALVFMFIDHSGKVLFEDMAEMRTLGRIAFPLYVWCMVVGFYRTRNVTRYLMRVLLVGLVSQPLYLFALNKEVHIGVLMEQTFLPLAGGFTWDGLWQVLYTVFIEKPNIFLTLLLGLIALCAVRDKDWLRKVWLPGIFVLGMTVLALIHDKKIDPIVQKISAPFSGGFSFGALLQSVRIIFWDTPNYFFVIFLVISVIWGFSGKNRGPGQVWGPVVMILLATVLKADYGWRGVLFILFLYAAQGSRPGIAAVMVSFMLFWGARNTLEDKLFGLKFRFTLLPDSISMPIQTLFRQRAETYSLAGLPLILIPFPFVLTLPSWTSWLLCPAYPGYPQIPMDIRLPKWLGYLLYPGHLVLLIVLKIVQFGWFA